MIFNKLAWAKYFAGLMVIGLISAAGVSPAASSVGTTATGRDGVHAIAGAGSSGSFCSHLGLNYEASTGAWALCQGAKQASGPGLSATQAKSGHPVAANVDAANLADEITPGGVRAYGQSGPSVAAAGKYVVEAWTDATGLYAPCPSPGFKEELTGIGFSANGGSSFKDLGGLRNNNCLAGVYGGDPSVVAYVAGGHTYFYVVSLYDSTSGLGPSEMALAACRASGSGSAARLKCGQPVVVATSSACQSLGEGVEDCNFLDKGFMTIDPARRRLYVSYSEFPYNGAGSRVELSVCDLGNAKGGAGPAGGTPAVPVCENGAHQAPAAPYLTVAPSDPGGCENEGAYPVVDVATGAVYVSYEYNWGTNINGAAVPPCGSIPTRDIMTKIPLSCLRLAPVSPCKRPAARAAVPVVSMAAADIPGFDGVPNDFPRPAVSPAKGTVSMVWNDARYHPLGDILLQSFSLSSLAPVQRTPVVLDRPAAGGLHLDPALRAAGASGRLDASWYARSSASATVTELVAALAVNPRTRSAPSANVLITTAASDWSAVSSDLTPSFGDYTDSYLAATGTAPYVSKTLYIAWTDGRLGVPQPFSAHVPAG